MPGSPKLAQFLCDWFGKVVNQPVVQPQLKSNPPERGQGNKVARQINPFQLINPEPLALGRRLNGVIFEIEMSSNWHANLLYDQANLPVLELSKVDAAPPKWRVFPLRRGA